MSHIIPAKRGAAYAHLANNSWSQGKIVTGGVVIPWVSIIESSQHHRAWTEYATLRSAHMEWFSGRKENVGYDLVEYARLSRLPRLQEEARNDGKHLSNDECVDILRVAKTTTQSSFGVEHNEYSIYPSRDEYYNFITTSADLDSTIRVDGVDTTLRSHWNPTITSISDVYRLPSIVKAGVQVTVVTGDNKIMMGTRSALAEVAPGGVSNKTALSVVTEGVEPGDCDQWGKLDPTITAQRAVREEYGIEPEHVVSLTPTGWFFDHEKWQVCFAFVMKVSPHSGEVKRLHVDAVDEWESTSLVAFPAGLDSDTIRVLRGDHDEYYCGSNHSQASLFFALVYLHGLKKLNAATVK